MWWKESLSEQAKTFSSLLSSEELETGLNKFLKMSEEVRGFHYFSGVGKNMFVAARVAATYDSLGIRSLYVDPVNTLHGSMGIFTNSDIFIAISKSGETEELNRFINALVNQGFENIVGVTANINSTLSSLCKSTIIVPVESEGDHLGMAPIASTMAFSAVLDAAAVHLSSQMGFSKKDFVRNHPGGSLGKTVL